MSLAAAEETGGRINSEISGISMGNHRAERVDNVAQE